MTTQTMGRAWSSMQRIQESIDRVTPYGMSVAALSTRLVLGYSFFLTGRGKLRFFEGTVDYFMDLGIPFAAANAAFVSGLELVGGLALIAGLGTRMFALLLSSTMVVALFTADGKNLLDAVLQRGSTALTDVVPLMFLVFLLWLVAFGAGRFSLDRVVFRRFSVR
jgi:putative oxidoreductase